VILHPGILALLAGSTLTLVMMLYGSWVGLRILTTWSFESSSEGQLELERKTYLVSTLASYALGFEIAAALLFLYTVDDLHELFVGAMCATGSLNANPVGWRLLAVKMLLLFLSPIWIAFNHFDQKAGDYPIIKGKYFALLGLTPLLGVDLVLQLQYFMGLDPEIITSCCGALFSESGSTVASELAGLPASPTMGVFYLGAALFLVTGLLCRVSRSRVPRYVLALSAIGLLLVSLASVISFVSLYVYQLPSHHCPFDMLHKDYGFIGYAIYSTLFVGVYFGLLPGLFAPLWRIPRLAGAVAEAEGRWLRLGMLSILVFVCVVSWPIVFGSLRMTAP